MVTRSPIFALFVTTPDNEVSGGADGLTGSRNGASNTSSATVPIVRLVWSLRNTKLCPALRTSPAKVPTRFASPCSVGPTNAPSDTRSADTTAKDEAMIGGACVNVPAEPRPTTPVPAFTVWSRAKFPEPVVSSRMLPLFVTTPDSAPTLSIWLVGGVPVPCSTSGPTVPTVRPVAWSRSDRPFPAPVTCPASTPSTFAPASVTGPAADTCNAPPLTIPPDCWI